MGAVNSKRLFVVAKCAQTLDGKTATKNGQSKWITSKETRVYARKKRDRFDAILVGIETVVKDNPRLTGVQNKKLVRIVVDSNLRVSVKARLFGQRGSSLVATTKSASQKKKNVLKSLNVDIIECPAKDKKVNLSFLFKELFKRGINKLLIEGGPTIIGAALKEALVDQLHIYIAPKIMCDPCAKSSIVGFSVEDINKIIFLKNLKLKRINQDILVVADVHRNH